MKKNTMIRKTSDLSIFKRLLAIAITKMQQILITKEGKIAFKLYYKLAEIHFKLHYGFKLKNAINSIGGSKTADLSVGYAAKRHASMILKANNLYKENKVTQKYYQEAAINAFIKNLR